jgi:hypothetical protein
MIETIVTLSILLVIALLVLRSWVTALRRGSLRSALNGIGESLSRISGRPHNS